MVKERVSGLANSPGFHTIVNSKIVSELSRMDAADVLRRAADLIEEHGWVKYDYRTSHNYVTALDTYSAILAAIGWQGSGRGTDQRTDTARNSAQADLAAFMRQINMRRDSRVKFAQIVKAVIDVIQFEDIVAWNDLYCLGEDEATDVLRRAADSI